MARARSARHRAAPSVVRPRPQRVTGPVLDRVLAANAAPAAPAPPVAPVPPVLPVLPVEPVAVSPLAKAKKKCCRSQPRCKRCPVVLMRTARLAESGLSGKDLKKAVKRARVA